MSIVEIVSYISVWLGVGASTQILSLIPQIRQRRPLDFQFRQREAIVSLSLYCAVLLAAVVIYFNQQVFTPAISTPQLLPLWPKLVLAVFSLAVFAAALLIRRQPLFSVGWAKQMLRPGLQVSLALLLLIVFLRGKIYSILDGVTQGEVVTLIAWLLIALAEETIFRGYIQLRLSSYWGARQGWVLTAILYTVWKMPMLIAAGLLLPYGLLLVVVQAFLTGWMMKKLGHVLPSSIYRAVSEWLILLV